ncbi:dUTP diphosphatase [Patescibacteria group bacterium]|nr:dUTP diphosphatase [Patescibacteria group bacterium]
MKVKITRIDKSLPLPIYKTRGSVGFDLITRESTLIKKGEMGFIPSNVIIEVPKDYALLIVARSSTPTKKGISMPHGIGILDQDYCGSKDEVLAHFYNFSNKDVLIKKGERVAQGIFVKIDIAKWQEISKIQKQSRGGFGSTDE